MPPVEGDKSDSQYPAVDSTEQQVNTLNTFFCAFGIFSFSFHFQSFRHYIKLHILFSSIDCMFPVFLTIQSTTFSCSSQGSAECEPLSLSAETVSVEASTTFGSPKMTSTPAMSSLNASVGSTCASCCSFAKEVNEKLDSLMGRIDKVEQKVRHLSTPPNTPFPETGSAKKGEKMLSLGKYSLYGMFLVCYLWF